MSTRVWFVLVGLAAFLAGAGAWWISRPPPPPPSVAPPAISGAPLYAAAFQDATGGARSLGQFQGRWIVVNFWATWCAPCREEMPAFSRLQKRWGERQVSFVGISSDPPESAAKFGRDLGLAYPLWVGGKEVEELSRRLGNARSVLPFTVLVDPAGKVMDAKAGPYDEGELDVLLGARTKTSAKTP